MRSLLYVVLAIAAVCAVVIAAASVLSLSPDGPPASAAPASSTVPAPVPGVQSGAVVIDGSAADWASVVPIWQEAGKSGAGADGIDVKRFMVAHDGSKLHVFLETEPTPQEHYERTKMTGWLGALYFDVDNDESTGSRGAISACGPMLRLSGYEFEIQADRREAIESIMKKAGPDDAVLLAGKGAENYQEIQGQRYPFSDRDEARAVLAKMGFSQSGTDEEN